MKLFFNVFKQADKNSNQYSAERALRIYNNINNASREEKQFALEYSIYVTKEFFKSLSSEELHQKCEWNLRAAIISANLGNFDAASELFEEISQDYKELREMVNSYLMQQQRVVCLLQKRPPDYELAAIESARLSLLLSRDNESSTALEDSFLAEVNFLAGTSYKKLGSDDAANANKYFRKSLKYFLNALASSQDEVKILNCLKSLNVLFVNLFAELDFKSLAPVFEEICKKVTNLNIKLLAAACYLWLSLKGDLTEDLQKAKKLITTTIKALRDNTPKASFDKLTLDKLVHNFIHQASSGHFQDFYQFALDYIDVCDLNNSQKALLQFDISVEAIVNNAVGFNKEIIKNLNINREELNTLEQKRLDKAQLKYKQSQRNLDLVQTLFHSSIPKDTSFQHISPDRKTNEDGAQTIESIVQTNKSHCS